MPLTVLGDPVARQYVSGVAWHCYEGDVPAQSPVHDAYPDKDAWLTECSGGEWSPKYAEVLGWMTDKLIIGASNNWSRGTLLWNLALDPKHGPHTAAAPIAAASSRSIRRPARSRATSNIMCSATPAASSFRALIASRRRSAAVTSKRRLSSIRTEAASRSSTASRATVR